MSLNKSRRRIMIKSCYKEKKIFKISFRNHFGKQFLNCYSKDKIINYSDTEDTDGPLIVFERDIPKKIERKMHKYNLWLNIAFKKGVE
ncbi:hypothetical protein [Streptococcus sp. 27098_8_76]|jgi:hypothetical protein|uniref:hypothetical protein n=1 Tax=Streptococcus sp. 27098_8_76 TaxID=3003658 RepID=UPI00206BFCD3|nr:MAG TPA: hypothetical protein [Caudoviricetes sp.]DAQ36991.1 MAG TPA: hypothetical protein [Caudoviricetes sp.]